MSGHTDDHQLRSLAASLLTPLAVQPAGVPARVRSAGPIRAVLFDIYGTLLISGSGDVGTAQQTPVCERAFADALSVVGEPPCAPELCARAVGLLQEGIRRFHSQRRAEGCLWPEVDILRIWRCILRELGIGASGSWAWLRRFALAYECLTNPVWPMPQLREVLQELRERKVALGLISNAQFYTPVVCEALLQAGLAELGFDRRLCSWSYLFLEAKPSPHVFRPVNVVLKQQGIAPHQVLYVGNDMLNDVSPAQSLGWKTALFAGDCRSYRPRHEDRRLAEVRPSAVVTELNQLLDLVPSPGT